MSDVFVGIEKDGGGTKVCPARDYQASAFHTFMSNDSVVKIDFNYHGMYIFNVQKFDTVFRSLQGTYPRFCVLVNNIGKKHILSDDKELLRGFAGWINRITGTNGGYKRKPVTKRKSTKRKSTKRKSTKKKSTKKKSTKKKPVTKRKSTKKR